MDVKLYNYIGQGFSRGDGMLVSYGNKAYCTVFDKRTKSGNFLFYTYSPYRYNDKILIHKTYIIGNSVYKRVIKYEWRNLSKEHEEFHNAILEKGNITINNNKIIENVINMGDLIIINTNDNWDVGIYLGKVGNLSKLYISIIDNKERRIRGKYIEERMYKYDKSFLTESYQNKIKETKQLIGMNYEN